MMHKVSVFIFAALYTMAVVMPVEAIDIEGVADIQTISTQSVSKDDVIMPYEGTGQSLVQLIRNMANFDVEGSDIVFNRRSAQIFVRNTPSNHEVIEHVLNKLRETRMYQVEIESRVMAIRTTRDNVLGLDFLGVDAQATRKGYSYGTDMGFNDGTYTTNSDFPAIVDATGYELGQLSFAALSSKFDIQAYIDAAKGYYQINVLAAPRIVVANNQRAHIKIEKAQYYIQSLESDSVDDASSVAVDPSIGVAQSGTLLDVTPTINANGTISLELHPQFVTVDLSTTQTINVADSDVINETFQPQVTLPIYTVQSADTTITIENGGVAVLAGLIEEGENKEFNKIPVLGDIPLVGKLLFKHEFQEETKTHLVIFVRGRIKDPHKSYIQ